MALVQVDFVSQKLKRTVTINAIIPVDKESGKRKEKFKTLYLLHGIFGNYTDWVCGTRIQRWAQDHDLAVIMPSGENKFYVDNDNSHEYFSQFIGEELIEVTRAMFPLSHQREDTFIAGLSMGGYGALTNGLKYHQTFGYIAALSSALMIDTFVEAKDGKDVPYMMKRSYLTSVFGDLTKLKGSDKDYKALIEKLDVKDVPAIYMACGTEDALLTQNRDYRDFLKAHHIPLTYEEGPGGHEWDFWDRYIKRVLEWLPINEKNEGLSSGHVEMDERKG
ncbi:esterase family protein [Allocoprobacillus halotolerans]|uniref:Esterase family protein n=1 Tax=Allocoprobacillus halotolerans TaxID=2944914 RepID=A0ABY5I5E8_9FIRM|nr:alpha/beta hydrolase family protein [Allocoprobacillus halotolerans]UTY40586.1 esterase family protein [Allocoprobacillus halotolerans]